MRYYRIHTADIAYITQQPRGIFTAIGKLVDAGILSEERGKVLVSPISCILKKYFERNLHRKNQKTGA